MEKLAPFIVWIVGLGAFASMSSRAEKAGASASKLGTNLGLFVWFWLFLAQLFLLGGLNLPLLLVAAMAPVLVLGAIGIARGERFETGSSDGSGTSASRGAHGDGKCGKCGVALHPDDHDPRFDREGTLVASGEMVFEAILRRASVGYRCMACGRVWCLGCLEQEALPGCITCKASLSRIG